MFLWGDRCHHEVSGEHGENPYVPCTPTLGAALDQVGTLLHYRRTGGVGMTQRDADLPESRLHQKGYALLPWCVNGTLETHERPDVQGSPRDLQRHREASRAA